MTRRALTNPEQAAEAQRAAESADRRYLDDLRKIMETPHGRRFWMEMERRTGIFKPSFDNSGSITARNEGMRLVGLLFYGDLERLDGGMDLRHKALLEQQQDQASS